MPAGWAHRRLGEIATISDTRRNEPGIRTVELVLTELFAGNNDGFVAWVGEQTKPLAYAHDLAMRDADLETVIQFLEAKARRTRPFMIPEQGATKQRMDPQGLFPDEKRNHP
jgi:hypothetical protein